MTLNFRRRPRKTSAHLTFDQHVFLKKSASDFTKQMHFGVDRDILVAIQQKNHLLAWCSQKLSSMEIIKPSRQLPFQVNTFRNKTVV